MIVFTTNNPGRLSERFYRRCEAHEFDGRSESFRQAMVELVRTVWKAETGPEEMELVPEGLGRFELADDSYSIGLALQQITSCIRTGELPRDS